MSNPCLNSNCVASIAFSHLLYILCIIFINSFRTWFIKLINRNRSQWLPFGLFWSIYIRIEWSMKSVLRFWPGYWNGHVLCSISVHLFCRHCFLDLRRYFPSDLIANLFGIFLIYVLLFATFSHFVFLLLPRCRWYWLRWRFLNCSQARSTSTGCSGESLILVTALFSLLSSFLPQFPLRWMNFLLWYPSHFLVFPILNCGLIQCRYRGVFLLLPLIIWNYSLETVFIYRVSGASVIPLLLNLNWCYRKDL